ncbi:Flp family type IVb pilin [Vibrio caribbeanicus]|uniref:Flp family type IVb pilin n=1 Tax=Vibrio caribbeanicus TaxID=701175 RepID=UPI0022848F5A|nr:Flp family type IVb pilin [Vibrio caribbeanicus]MCY9845604.1 Flp family type IVb pilin [Vibrio caribbeanicus]
MKNLVLKAYVNYKLKLENLAKDERGVTAIEYAIIGVSIAAICAYVFGVDGPLATALKEAIEKIANYISGVDVS